MVLTEIVGRVVVHVWRQGCQAVRERRLPHETKRLSTFTFHEQGEPHADAKVEDGPDL